MLVSKMKYFDGMVCPKCETRGKVVQSRICGLRVICLACGQAIGKNTFLKYNENNKRDSKETCK